MLGLLFALARIASAAWVGAAVLFVAVAVTQTRYLLVQYDEDSVGIVGQSDAPTLHRHLRLDVWQRKHVVAELTLRRFPLYYWTGGALLGVSLLSSAFLRRRYLKASRWTFIMVLLLAAAGLMAYDFVLVYRPLVAITQKIAVDPKREVEPEFATLHEHSKQVNITQVLVTFVASLLLCFPGTRPEPPTMMMKTH